MLTNKDITIELEKQDNGNWTGGISEFGLPALPLIGFPGEGEYGRYLSIIENLTEVERESGKEPKKLGFMNFTSRVTKKDGKPFETLTCRLFLWNGIAMPIQGLVYTGKEKPFVKLVFDSYYYTEQEKHWMKAGHSYVFENPLVNDPQHSDNETKAEEIIIEEECPF